MDKRTEEALDTLTEEVGMRLDADHHARTCGCIYWGRADERPCNKWGYQIPRSQHDLHTITQAVLTVLEERRVEASA